MQYCSSSQSSSPAKALLVLSFYLILYQVTSQGVIAQTIQTANPITQQASVKIQDNKDVSTCNCDLTANSCDVGCCCDDDCGENYACTSGTTVEVTGAEGCIGQKYILRYKLRPGMRTYFDNNKNRRCFQSDNSAVRSDFKSLITSTQETMADLFKSQISSFQKSLNQTGSTFNSFTQGTEYTVRSRIKATTPIRVFNSLTQKYINFPMPQQNSYGTCTVDSNFSPLYLQSASSQCSRVFQQADCSQTSLQIQYWQTDIKILRLPTDQQVNMIAPTVIVCNTSPCSSNPISPIPSTTLAGNTCNNAVRSISLNLTYDKNSNQITAAQYQIFVQDESSLPKIITQAFRVNFIQSSASSSTNSNNLSPGYLTGEKLLVSKFSNGIRQINSEGFYLKGADSNGDCNSSTFADSKRLNYGQNVIVTCKKSLNLADFRTYCQNSNFRNQQLFTNIQTNLKQIGILTTAQQSFRDDWATVIGIDEVLTSTTPNFVGPNQCSNILAGIKINVITSKAGNIYKSQNYIVSAKVEPITETWIFSSQAATQQVFLHYIDVRFGQIIPSQVQDSQLTPSSWLPELPGVSIP